MCDIRPEDISRMLCRLFHCTIFGHIFGENYLEIDVDIESSAIANVVLHLALGYVTVVMIDMRFVVEAQEEEELPERLIGAVRIAQMELSSATFLETPVAAPKAAVAGKGTAKVNDGRD
ncbi:uncharacterized protein A4U43_C06F6830 [Asparagus officinalis]|uniref:Protein ENHANCED DISEASE RESISTANCE 2 C-terminal domain-containing protein n=1 Tax=Asparagus officinalis TaxID=4686 RepID=A0A5P1EP67_ASPOF|nr:uncharacterized protein A4U43_C06F6830 [Asparagus officinalis]